MSELIGPTETAVRLGFFFGSFVPVALWEAAASHGTRTRSRRLRWYANIGIVALSGSARFCKRPGLRIVFRVPAVCGKPINGRELTSCLPGHS